MKPLLILALALPGLSTQAAILFKCDVGFSRGPFVISITKDHTATIDYIDGSGKECTRY